MDANKDRWEPQTRDVIEPSPYVVPQRPPPNKDFFDQPSETIRDENITDQIVIDPENLAKPTRGTIDVILCVNGVPFNATISGTIGDEVT